MYVGSRLKRAWKSGRRHLKSLPSSRTGENPPYGMIGGVEETSASFEARSAPRSYPTELLPRCEREVICPSGGFLTGLSSLISDFPKDISVPTYPKSDLERFASHPTRGAFRERHGRGVECGGRGSVLRATGLQGGLAKGL